MTGGLGPVIRGILELRIRRGSRRVHARLLLVGALSAGLLAAGPALAGISVGTPMSVSGSTSLAAVACPSATDCFAVGRNDSNVGVVVHITNGVPGTPSLVTGTTALEGVACSSATSCVAVGGSSSNKGMVVPISNGAVGSAVPAAGTAALNAVTCFGASCEAVGNTVTATSVVGAVVSITASTGTPGVAQPVPSSGQLSGVACSSATRCEAVGEVGNPQTGAVVSITSGVPGSATAVAGTASLFGVACPSTTSCTAVGATALDGSGSGAIVPLINGAPGTPLTHQGNYLYAIACPSASSCESAGSDNASNGDVVQLTDGRPGLPTPVPGPYALSGLACVGASCEAVGVGGSNFNTHGEVVSFTITTIATTTSVSSSANPSRSGQPVRFTATVRPASGGDSPTGAVTFKDGSATLGTAALSAGTATLSTSSLARGSHKITAIYNGDGSFAGSTSPALTQTVKAPPPNTRIDKKPPGKITTTKRKVKVSFRFSSSEAGSHFKCKLDKSPFRACTTPKSYFVGPGSHKFSVKAINSQGTADATPATAKFKVIFKKRRRH